MQFTPTRAAAALALAFAILGASTWHGAAAAREPVETGEIGSNYTPLGLSTQPQRVILKLADDPVAVVNAKAGRTLSQAQKDGIAAGLRAKQDGLRPAVAATGGRVLATFQHAYNGIKVEVPRQAIRELRSLPGVVSVHRVEVFHREHQRSVPLLGAPAAWGGAPRITGAGAKIAIIDTGIDYTHANFGGPGTVAAFTAADAADTAPANPAYFGTDAPKVKGGIDLVGDDYDAAAPPLAGGAPNPKWIPHPDPNPLDCNGHGSHVAGSAAGFGVTTAGTTYSGPYNETTLSQSFRIAPGVAPRAQLYAVRVFGCAGSTDVVVEAIDWAVENGMDVINMSLGSTFGIPDSEPSAEAANNAAASGVIVVGSAGNSGPSPYIIGTPNSAIRTIAVAASEPWATTPGVRVRTTPPSGTALDLQAINANGYEFTGPLSGPLVVLQDDPATTSDEEGFIGSADESQGCSPRAYTSNGVVAGGGQIAVARRGTCARVAKAIFGQQAGAAAVIMTNNAAALPPFEGPITRNPDTGIAYTVTIPFVGVAGNQAAAGTDSSRLRASPAGTTANLSSMDLVNANFKGFASFTSNGPRQVDSQLKPDVTAPGVSIFSTAVGTGNLGSFNSGTSMAAPHVAGVAALVRQANRHWSVEEVKAAIMSTADPAQVLNYATSRAGTGFVRAAAAATTKVTASGDEFTSSLSFGFAEVDRVAAFDQTRQIRVRNYGTSAITFDVAAILPQGSAHSVQLSRAQVTVPARGSETVDVRLIVPSATIGNNGGHRQAAGVVKFTPVGGGNGGIALHVPYLLVPRPVAHVEARLEKSQFTPSEPTTTATVSNIDGTIGSAADFYAWGLQDGDDGLRFNDVRAVGTQTFDAPTGADPARRFLAFAVNHWRPWSHASINETNIFIDVDGDGTDDYVVAVADLGLMTTGLFDGNVAVGVFSTRSAGGSIAFLATAPTNASTLLAPVRIWSSSAAARQLCRAGEPCLSASNPRLTYRVETFGLQLPQDDEVPGAAKFNAWSSSISQGMLVPLPPNATAAVPVSVNVAEWALTPAMGVMVVSQDNRNGQDEARLTAVSVD